MKVIEGELDDVVVAADSYENYTAPCVVGLIDYLSDLYYTHGRAHNGEGKNLRLRITIEEIE